MKKKEGMTGRSEKEDEKEKKEGMIGRSGKEDEKR